MKTNFNQYSGESLKPLSPHESQSVSGGNELTEAIARGAGYLARVFNNFITSGDCFSNANYYNRGR